jgi:hypothetical protein
MLGSSVLGRVETTTDLGVVLDSKLYFRAHIDATVAKSLAMLGFIKRLAGEFRDSYALKILYVSLLRPKLEYACCVYGSLSIRFISIELKRSKENSLNMRCAVLDGICTVICPLTLIDVL